MNRFITKSIALIALVGAFTLGSASQSEAALSLRLSDEIGTVTINDLDADGIIAFNGAVGNWNLNVTTGLGAPFLPNQPHLDLNSVNASNIGGASTLTIMLTQTDNSGGGGVSIEWGGTNNNSTVNGSVYGDAGNAAFALTDLIASAGPFGPNGAFAASAGGASPGYAGAYSLTSVLTISKGAGFAIYSGDMEVVPEPATLALLGLGLAGLAARRRRKA